MRLLDDKLMQFAESDANRDALAHLFLLHFRKNEDFNLCESTDILEMGVLNLFWRNMRLLSELTSENISEGNSNNSEEKDEEFRFLKSIATFVNQYLEGNHRRPTSFLDTLEVLHNLLLVISDETYPDAKSFKIIVAKSCEQYWLRGYDGAESVILHLIPYLLSVVTGVSNERSSAKDADVRRLYNIRSAMLLLDFSDPSIESIQDLLCLCFNQPVVLKAPEGRRFLSFAFTLSLELHHSMLLAMKYHIASVALGLCSTPGDTDRKMTISQVSSAYGDILLRAWKDLYSTAQASGLRINSNFNFCESKNAVLNKSKSLKNKKTDECCENDMAFGAGEVDTSLLDSFESNVLQLLLHDAVHANNLKYFNCLSHILQFFHNEKNTRGVDSLLVKIYSPIIWRSLKCSNAIVRAQSTALFCNVFPLRPNNTTAAEDDELMQKHFNMFTLLLKDTDHRVRSSAVTGICRVLKDYWEPIPVNISVTILTFMINTMSRDTSSSMVRISVVQGLRMVLENCPLSHPVLKKLLPLLGNTLHDNSEKVRYEFIMILNKIKDVRSMHFYDISTPEQLLQRLVLDGDKPTISNAISSLLLSNFYPQQLTPEEETACKSLNSVQLDRCVKFIQQDIRAAVSFYHTLSEHISIASATKFAVNLFMDMNSEVEGLCLEIDKVLNSKDKTTESVDNLISNLIPICELPIGYLQVLLSLLLGMKTELVGLKRGNPIIELFNRYFTSSKFSSVLKQLFAAIESTCCDNDVCNADNAEYIQCLSSKWTIIWSLYLQLVSTVTFINPAIAEVTGLNLTSRNNKSNRSKRSAQNESFGENFSMEILCNSVNLLTNNIMIFGSNGSSYDSLLYMLVTSTVECMCAWKNELLLLSRIAQSINSGMAASLCKSTDDHRLMVIQYQVGISLLTCLLEDQNALVIHTKQPKQFVAGTNKMHSVSDHDYCMMLINFGYPMATPHLKDSRRSIISGSGGDEVKLTLSNLFAKLSERVEHLISLPVESAEMGVQMSQMVSLMTKACSLWVCYELQCSLSDHSQKGSSDTDTTTKHISQLVSVSSGDRPTSRVQYVWTWIDNYIVLPLSTARKDRQAPSNLMLPAIFGTVLGVLGDYLLVCETGCDTTSILLALGKWMKLLTSQDKDSLLLSTTNFMMMQHLHRLCYCLYSNANLNQLPPENSLKMLVLEAVNSILCVMARIAVYGPHKSSDCLTAVFETILHCNSSTIDESNPPRDTETIRHIFSLLFALHMHIKTIPLPLSAGVDIEEEIGNEFVSCVHTSLKHLEEKSSLQNTNGLRVKAHIQSLLDDTQMPVQSLQRMCSLISECLGVKLEANEGLNIFKGLLWRIVNDT